MSKFDSYVCRFKEDQEQILAKTKGYQGEVTRAMLATLEFGVKTVKSETEEQRFRNWLAQELKKAWKRLTKLDDMGVKDAKLFSAELRVDCLICLYESTNDLHPTRDQEADLIVGWSKQRKAMRQPRGKNEVGRKRELGPGAVNRPDKRAKLASERSKREVLTPIPMKKGGVPATNHLTSSKETAEVRPGMHHKQPHHEIGRPVSRPGLHQKRKRPVRRSVTARKMLKELHTNGVSPSPSVSPPKHPRTDPVDELESLHQRKKLMLLCDVDETLVSTGCDDPRASKCLWHPKLSKNFIKLDFKDPKVPPGKVFYSMLRPGLREFLKSVSELYDVVMYSAGTRPYLENLFSKIDPGGLPMRSIISMHDVEVDSQRKVFTAAFPYRDQCVIIDDIATVWTTPQDVYTIPRFAFWERTGSVSDLTKDYEKDNELAQCLETLKSVHSTYYKCLDGHKPKSSPEIMRNIVTSEGRNLRYLWGDLHPIPLYPPLPRVRAPLCINLLRKGECEGCQLFHPIPPNGTIQYGQPISLCHRYCAGDCNFKSPPGSQCARGYHWTENEEQHFRHTGCLPARKVVKKAKAV